MLILKTKKNKPYNCHALLSIKYVWKTNLQLNFSIDIIGLFLIFDLHEIDLIQDIMQQKLLKINFHFFIYQCFSLQNTVVIKSYFEIKFFVFLTQSEAL